MGKGEYQNIIHIDFTIFSFFMLFNRLNTFFDSSEEAQTIVSRVVKVEDPNAWNAERSAADAASPAGRRCADRCRVGLPYRSN